MAPLIVTVFLFLLLAGSGIAQEQKHQRLNVVWSTIGGTTSSLWVTKDAGIFAKHGLDVQLILILASTRAAASIVAGDVDIGLIGSTAPGVLTQGSNGISDAIVQHLDFTLVTPSNPAPGAGAASMAAACDLT